MTLLSFLEAAGVVVLVLLGVGALVVAVVGWSVARRLVRRVGEQALATVPAEVRLVALADAAWPDAALAARLLAELAEEGYTTCGTYRVDPLEGQQVALLVAPDGRSAAAVVAHPREGTWVELTALDRGGGEVTSTTGRAGPLDSPPWARRVAHPGSSVGALVESFRREAPPDAVRVTCSELPDRFAAEWRRETAWRRGRGLSLREVVAAARRSRRR